MTPAEIKALLRVRYCPRCGNKTEHVQPGTICEYCDRAERREYEFLSREGRAAFRRWKMMGEP